MKEKDKEEENEIERCLWRDGSWQSFEMTEKGPSTITIDLFDVLSLPIVDSMFYRFPNTVPSDLLKGVCISKTKGRIVNDCINDI